AVAYPPRKIALSTSRTVARSPSGQRSAKERPVPGAGPVTFAGAGGGGGGVLSPLSPPSSGRPRGVAAGGRGGGGAARGGWARGRSVAGRGARRKHLFRSRCGRRRLRVRARAVVRGKRGGGLIREDLAPDPGRRGEA